MKATAAGEGGFGGGEIAFRTDHDGEGTGEVAESFGGEEEGIFDRAGVGLERGDEGPFRAVGLGEEILGRNGEGDVRQKILARLFAGFEGDRLPFLTFAFGISRVELDNGAIGKEGDDAGRAQFDGLLDNQIHVFAFGDGLDERDLAGEGRRGGALFEMDFDASGG